MGFDLLGAALAEARGRPYADLLRERITGPLGMADTTLAPSAEQCARSAGTARPATAASHKSTMTGERGSSLVSPISEMRPASRAWFDNLPGGIEDSELGGGFDRADG